MDTGKLSAFLTEVSNWNWEDFVRAEHDDTYTSDQAMIFAIFRACAMEKMDAIRLATNRLDGLLPTPIRFEYPKIFVRFPRAEALPEGQTADALPEGEIVDPGGELAEIEVEDAATMSLRATVKKMSSYPRNTPKGLIKSQDETERWLRGEGPEPEYKAPSVKSVIAAHLLEMAQKRDIGALSEVFDQIDGKLVQTIQVLGEDIYLNNYSPVAPDGAKPGPDGVMQIEMPQLTDLWAKKLAKEGQK